MRKSQKQRIEDAARVLRTFDNTETYERLAERVLSAADRERPDWPTAESLSAYFGETGPGHRICLRAAFLADPIIKAAVAYASRATTTMRSPGDRSLALSLDALVDAVREAGLL